MHDGGLPPPFVDVDHASDRLPGAKLLHQLAGPVHRLRGEIRIESLLKEGGGIRPLSDLSRGETDIGTVEAGRLQHHGLYAVLDL